MYRTIYVPVDNSDHSNASIDLAIALGKAFGSKMIGSHVYAAKLHDVRFKQMEFTLPDEYKEEEELERQRKIHDALIARGLHLISDSYLDQMGDRCGAASLEFERKHFDGKNFEAIVGDINDSGYDMVVLGALGMGAVKDSQCGSVCERTLRRTKVDTLVVRDPAVHDASAPGRLLACVDGSPESHGAVQAAIALSRAFGKEVEALAVARPGHPEDAALAAHLDVARELGRRAGVAVTATLATGSPRAEILARAQAEVPWLLLAGRVGMDGPGGDVGSIAEHLCRTAPCNVFLSSRTLNPATALDAVA